MFDKVVFAGGGQRCWWQAGFWDRVSSGIELHPRVIAGVSSGAVIACLLYASDSKRALGWYERELKSVRSNFNWLNLLRRDRRLMPNAAIQRKALRALLGGDSFRQLMWRAPEIRVQYARLPEGANPSRAVLGAMVAGRAGRPARAALGADAGRRAGFDLEVKRVQDCRSERELVDLLAAANSAPPFTAEESLDGAPCVDAGLFGEVPLVAVADVPGQTLVLDTRRDPALAPVFARDGCVHVQPSERIPVGRWDYTSVARYRQAYELGQRDGEAFLKTFALGQYVDPGLSLLAAVPAPADAAQESVVKETAKEPAAPGEANGQGESSEKTGAAEPGDGAEAAEAVEGSETAGASAGTEEAIAATARAPDSEPPDAGAGADGRKAQAAGLLVAKRPLAAPADRRARSGDRSSPISLRTARGRADADAADAADEADLFPPMHATDDVDRDEDGVLDVSAKLAAYREPTDAGTAEDLRASQPAGSEGQARSGRSLRASNT
jgi:hypothetical protein